MLNPQEITAAVAAGLSIICATCKKHADAVAQGRSECLATDGCGGPMSQDTFHEYEGPITDFLRFCFVCGARSTKGIRVRNHVRILGACDTHVEFVKHLAPTQPRRLPVLQPGLSLLDGKGEQDAQTAIKTRYSLAALMRDLARPKGT